jgi:outer membrane protein assembly factor BamB
LRLFIFSISFLVVIILSGCPGISLNYKLSPTVNDWSMAGGSHLQQNVTKNILEPPLQFVWRYNADAGFGQSVLSGSDGVVFANTLQGEMHSVEIESGKKIGHLDFLGKEAATTPLIINNILILGYAGSSNSSLTSYNLLTSLPLWEKQIGDIQASPVIYGGNIYVGSLNGNLYKIDERNGNTVWEYRTNAPVRTTVSASGSSIIFPDDKGEIFCIDTSNASLKWKYDTGVQVVSPSLVYNNKLYFGSYDSNYYCISIDSGKVLWKKNMSSKLASGSALFNENVIFSGINGSVYSLKTGNGEYNWQFRTRGVLLSTPLVSGNYVYLTSMDTKLYCLKAGTGELVWSYELEYRSRTSPIITGNFLIAASDYYIYCFKK